MARPVTLFTGQWADLPLATLAEKAAAWGYDGLELVERALVATNRDHVAVALALDLLLAEQRPACGVDASGHRTHMAWLCERRARAQHHREHRKKDASKHHVRPPLRASP